MRIEEGLLDDLEAIEAGDPKEMLRATASAGAQVRYAVAAAHDAEVARLADEGRPRAILVAGMGGSGISGDVLAAVAGTAATVPLVVHRGYGLPGWVGPTDLVMGVSCSGTTEETLSAVDEAGRRGARLLTVGAAGSPLADLGVRGHGVHVAVDAAGRMPRACLWMLSVPLLVAADALGVVPVPADALDAAADRLDEIAERCRPAGETFANPGKSLAVELAGSLPVLWGSTDLAGVAAYRFACQLNENANYPAVSGVLPEANHNQIVTLDGAFGAAAVSTEGDFFRDRMTEPDPARMRLVLLADADEHPQLRRRRELSRALAEARGVAVSELVAEGAHRVERLASLVGVIDFASVYLALTLGVDPTTIAPIDELKQRIAQ
jgi:glucose/mannose-6-phosphate isomerase